MLIGEYSPRFNSVLVPAIQPVGEPVIHCLGNRVVVGCDGDAIVVVTENILELVFRLCLGLATPPLDDPLACGGIADSHCGNPALAVAVPVKTSVSTATPTRHSPPPIRASAALRSPEWLSRE